jgi:paxillin
MEDLDSLLEDLGRGKSASTVKKQRPPSSRVDLNELEDLMEDLAAPTPKQAPEPTPAIKPQTVSPTQTTTQNNRPVANTTSNGNGHTTQTTAPQSAKATSSSATNGGAVDDLDALMESLNQSSSSRNSRRQSQKPLSVPANSEPAQTKTQTPAPAPAPKTTTATATTTTTNNAYVPPKQQDPAPVNNPPPQSTQTNRPTSNPPPRNSVKDDLDSLLNNLNQQMSTIDAENPASRGTCGTCKGAILGEMIQALGRSYHPEHITCGNCRQPLGTRNFYDYNGAPHCENCYQELFCPKCAHCDKPVLDRCITAMGKKWHVDHFICTQCLKPFNNGTFFERDGRPYCEQDFFGMYAPKCASCREAIRGDCINALGQQWHPEHFACSYCQKSFNGGSFFESGGKPYCETHYHQQTGSLCSGCGKPITGRCVNALDKKWHPEHFVCAFCMNPLSGGSFTEHNSKAYCKECHGKLFGA